MSKVSFHCGIHDFSTDDIKKWDEHIEQLEHEYDLRLECPGCGKKIHVRPNVKLPKSAKRIPRGILCSKCIKRVQGLKEIKEVEEIKNE